MKRIPIILVAFWLCATSNAGALGNDEIARVRSEVTSMMESFKEGDAQALIDRTHDSLYKLYGSKEALESATRQAVEQLLASGVRVLDSQVGTPTSTFAAGDEEVCFVPTASVMEVQGKRVRSTSFMLAIRRGANGDWKYLDGAPFRDKPELLYEILPKLPRVIELPANKLELL